MPTQDPQSNAPVLLQLGNQAGVTGCLGFLSPSSVTAYNNRDLIPNGYIDTIGTPSRYIQPAYLRLGSQIVSDRMYINLLPSDRIFVEFWYSVTTKKTGTRLQDQGNLGGFGVLGGGAGASYISALGYTKLGDIEPVKSNWTYHICESETKINRKFTVSKENFIKIGKETYCKIELPDYILGVLGVTTKPITFVTPTAAITDEQRAEVAQKTPEQILQALGFLKTPSEMTDTEIRIVLGLKTELDELGSLGNPSGRLQAWPHTYDGSINASYTNYSSTEGYNLFERIDRDYRKNLFRSDNEVRELTNSIDRKAWENFYLPFLVDKDNARLPSLENAAASFSSVYNQRTYSTHSYTNRSIDDITDKVILIKTKSQYTKSKTVKDPKTKEDKIVTEIVPVTIKDGDTVYVSYVGGKPILRQGVETDMRFYLFQTNDVSVQPPLDYVKTWNFKKYTWRLPKDITKYKILPQQVYNLVDDYEIIKKINAAEAKYQSTKQESFRATKLELEASLSSVAVEGQRLCETKAANGVVGRPFIIGCYFIDARGFCSCNFTKNDEIEVLVPYENVSDQKTFNVILKQIQSEVSPAYDKDGIIIIDVAKKALFDDFYFDVDELVNTLCTDNEKYGYERRLATLLKKFKPPTVEYVQKYNSSGKAENYYNLKSNTGACLKLDLIRLKEFSTFDFASFLKFLLSKSSMDLATLNEWALRLDLYGAKFEPVAVIGKPMNLPCNPAFVPANDTFSQGYITADALMKTSEILPGTTLSTKTRIYVEVSQLYNPLRKNGGIWVGTKPFSFPNFAVATDKFNNYACVAYTDTATGILKYRIFNNNVVLNQIKKLENSIFKTGGLPDSGHDLPEIDYVDKLSKDANGNTLAKNDQNHTYDVDLQEPGYDKILGGNPNYFNGKEIYLNEAGLIGGYSQEQKTIYNKHKKSPIYLHKSTADEVYKRNKIVFGDGLEDYFINIDEIYTDLEAQGGTIRPIYVGQIKIKGTLTFEEFSYSLLTQSDSQLTYEKVTDTLGFKESRFISLTFPAANKVIDELYIDIYSGKNMQESAPKKQDAYKKADFELLVDMDYTLLKPFQIRQRPCVFIDNLEVIMTDYLFEDEYNLRKIETQTVSACFDDSQNLYIFYEDPKARNGSLQRGSATYDGANISGVKGYGFSEKVENEISCLYSPNLGRSWYDFKAIIRTKYRELISNPFAYSDFNSNFIHLFYTLNGNLMHKKIDPNDFNMSDSSLGYRRPLLLDDVVTPNYGLYHFSHNGIGMRNSSSNVVLGNTAGKYLSTEIAIAAKRKALGYPDIRIEVAGDFYDFEKGIGDVDYFAYRDRTGQLNLMYAANGLFYQRQSNTDGVSWYKTLSDLYIHKNAKEQEYRQIKKLGYGYDQVADILYLTYICDDMLFLRKCDADARFLNTQASSIKKTNVEYGLDPDAKESSPIFIAGLIPNELQPAMNSKGNHFVFPYYIYSDWLKFADPKKPVYAISDFQCLGYPLGNGMMRFFYIDYYGNLQGFTYNNTPILDVGYKK